MPPLPHRSCERAAILVIVAGVVSALHVGKLPPAIPVLRETLGVTLVQAGFLLSLVQLAGMLLGALVGMLADRVGPRRVMLAGLLLLSAASAVGAASAGVEALLLARAVEGMGFLLAVLPAPGLIRRMVHDPATLSRFLGLWGAYMPIGTATALLLGPWAFAVLGWRWSWLGLALLSAGAWWMVWRQVPGDERPVASAGSLSMGRRLATTLSAAGPWCVALAFLMYSGQWLAVVGFLPTIYTQAGWSVGMVGALTALAAGINLVGNIGAGRLLARGVQPGVLLWTAYLTMAAGSVVAFAWVGHPVAQYLAVLVFSAVGGLIPGTLFSLAVRLSPSPQTVSTTVGWVQQLSSLGQFIGPPVVAWLAAFAGGWHLTWWFTVACSVAGVVFASLLQRLSLRPPAV